MKTITTLALALTTITLAPTAQADGFLCEGQQTGLKIKVYNNTDANVGTRVPAIMVVSDPSIASNSKTIATFKNVNRTLTYQGYGLYEAKVDLRFNDSGRAGENIAGTKLGQLSKIFLEVAFDYGHGHISPAAAQYQMIKGEIDYVKRNGEVLSEKAECIRYVKN